MPTTPPPASMRLPVHGLTPYLRVAITTDDRTLTIEDRRALCGTIPLWRRRIEVPLTQLTTATVGTIVRSSCVVAATALALAIVLFDLPVAVEVPLGVVAVLSLLLAPIKAIHVARSDGHRWTVPVCWRHAFDASVAMLDAEQRRDVRAAGTPRSDRTV